VLLGGGSAVGLVVCFIAAAALVVAAGARLSVYGDALAKRTGLGAGLIGLVFLAGVTSLPELVVSTASTISASLTAASMQLAGMPDGGALDALDAVWVGGADLALGNMLGSNVFNLMLIAVMDLVQGRGALMHRLSRHHVMAAAAGLGMLGLVMFGYAICGNTWGGTSYVLPLLGTGPVTPLLPIVYLLALALQRRHEADLADSDESPTEKEGGPPQRLLTMSGVRFYTNVALYALLIVAGGVWLSVLGDRLAQPAEAGGLGLGQTFVGTVFLAISTSLPEFVVAISAVRMGCFDMAFGNVLGSNMFNLAVIFVADTGLRGASLLHWASPPNLVTMGMVTMLTCVVLVGLCYRSKRSVAWLGIEVWGMVAVYVAGSAALFWLR
jgi:cation:H+ antiporter